MAKKFLVNIDLGGNQLISGLAHNATSAPTAYGKGQLWFDTTNNQLNVYNGSAFVPLTTGGTAVTSLNGFTGGVNIYGTASQITVTPTTGSITLSLPSTVSMTTACATNFYGTFNGTATNATQLGGQASTYYAPIASPNFTTGASVGGAALATQSFVTTSYAPLASPSFTGTVNLGSNTATGSVSYATNAGNATTTSQTNFTSLTISSSAVATQAYVGTASVADSAKLGGTVAASYALLSSANFTAASVGGVAVATQSYVNSTAWNNTSASVAYATNAGTATNSTQLGGTAAASYALLSSANFTAASVGGSRIVTTSDKLSVHAATTSSELAGIISDETGSGSLVFSGGPTFTGTVNGAALTLSGALTASTGTTTLGTTNVGAFTATSASIGSAAIATQSFVSTSYAPLASPSFTGTVNLGSNTATGSVSYALNSASLGGVLASSYAQLASSNFTAASVGGNRITTVADKFTAHTAAVTSSELLGLISDETGTGNLVFNTSPSFVTPNIGNATGSVTYATNAGNATTTSQTSFTTLSTSGDVNVGGNIYISGSTTIISGSTTTVADPLLYIANNNPANLNDIGFLGHFTSSTYQHTGLFRQASTGIWQLVSGVVPEPGATVDVSSAVYDPIRTGGLQISSGSTVTTASITSAGVGNFAGLNISGASVATQSYVTSQGYLTSSSTPNFTSASVGGFAVAKKYVGSISGNSAATSFTITHNIGTSDVVARVYQTSATPDTQYADVEVDIVRTSASVVTVSFATAPVTGTTYNAVIVG